MQPLSTKENIYQTIYNPIFTAITEKVGSKADPVFDNPNTWKVNTALTVVITQIALAVLSLTSLIESAVKFVGALLFLVPSLGYGLVSKHGFTSSTSNLLYCGARNAARLSWRNLKVIFNLLSNDKVAALHPDNDIVEQCSNGQLPQCFSSTPINEHLLA